MSVFCDADSVKQTSTSGGTGDITLSGAVLSCFNFSARMAVGDTCYYAIREVDGNGNPTGPVEIGYGTYSAANTLTRTRVIRSSNSDGLVNFTAGTTKQVYITVTSEHLNSFVVGVADYAAVRAYTGSAPALSVKASGVSGLFIYDSADTTSADNSATVLVDSSSRRWKRNFSGYYSAAWWGLSTSGSASANATALQAAIDSLSTGLGATLYIPSGVYNLAVSSVTLKSKVILRGAGRQVSQFVAPNGSTGPLLYCAGSSTATSGNVYGVHIFDLGFVCNDGTRDTTESAHFINVNGITNLTIEGCLFKGSRADGIYLGGDAGGPSIRSNVNTIIRNNIFDGVNNLNRNAISIIAGDGVTVDSNYFVNWTDTTMPGPIDIEPNYNSQICRNISITNNRFENNGGGRIICLWTPSMVMTTPITGIVVKNNFIAANNTHSDATFVARLGETLSTASVPNSILYEGNTDLSPVEPFYCQYVRGFKVINNTFNNGSCSELGVSNTATLSAMDVEIGGNSFVNCSNSTGALLCYSITNLNIHDNLIQPQSTHTVAIHFYGSGATTISNNVSIRNNVFSKGASSLAYAVRATSHTFSTIDKNQYRSNIETGGGPYVNQFSAENSDFMQTWTPTIIGGTTAGAGTYTVQSGRYTRTGNKLKGDLTVTLTAHTGTGEMRINLPNGWPGTTRDANYNAVCAVKLNNTTFTANKFVVGVVSSGKAYMVLTECVSAGATANLAIDGTMTVSASFEYEIDL